MDNSAFKILLVDDEPDILEFLGYNLKKEGYEILTASNGKDAIEIAKKELPHLIVLDVMMPDMDGIETCRVIRETPELKDKVKKTTAAMNVPTIVHRMHLDQKYVCRRTIVSESGRSTWRNGGIASIRHAKSFPPCSRNLFGFLFIRRCDLPCKATGSGL